MKRLAGASSVCLDAYGTDPIGKKYDMEIQREDKGTAPHRARFHSSVLDIENLDAGQEFRELPDTYTIFITEKDFYGKGEPVYLIERMNITTGKPFADGEHILYVNGEYRGDSDIGKLMHDFNCTDAADLTMDILSSVLQAQRNKSRADGLTDSEIRDKFSEQTIKNALSEATESIAASTVKTMEGTMYKRVLEERSNVAQFMAHNSQIWEKAFVTS